MRCTYVVWLIAMSLALFACGRVDNTIEGSIVDQQPGLTISTFPNTISIDEGDTATLFLGFAAPIEKPIELEWEIVGGQNDFLVHKKSASLAAGATQMSIEINALADNLIEASIETFKLKIN